MEPDFVATELLRELKSENMRKSRHLKRLQIALIVSATTSLVTLLSLVSVFILYLR